MKKSRQLLSLAISAGTLLWGISVMAQGGIEGSTPNNPVLNMIGEDYSFSPVPPASNKAATTRPRWLTTVMDLILLIAIIPSQSGCAGSLGESFSAFREFPRD